MAEFLVYDKEHWMDKLTDEELIKFAVENKHFMDKYNARYQRGDIVEVRPDGFWTDGRRKGFGSHAFALVVVPGLEYEKARKYQETYEENEKYLKKRKYAINMAEVVFDANKIAIIQKSDIDKKVKDKSKENG